MRVATYVMNEYIYMAVSDLTSLQLPLSLRLEKIFEIWALKKPIRDHLRHAAVNLPFLGSRVPSMPCLYH
jgi:hypothetical protein